MKISVLTVALFLLCIFAADAAKGMNGRGSSPPADGAGDKDDKNVARAPGKGTGNDDDDDENDSTKRAGKKKRKSMCKNPMNTDPNLWFNIAQKDAKQLAEKAKKAVAGVFDQRSIWNNAQASFETQSKVFENEFKSSFGAFLPAHDQDAKWAEMRPGIIDHWTQQYNENLHRFARWFIEHFMTLFAGFTKTHGLSYKKIEDDSDKKPPAKKNNKKDGDGDEEDGPAFKRQRT